MLRSVEEATRRPWARLAEGAGEPALTWLGKDEQPYSMSPGIRARATFNTAAAEALFAGAPRSFAQVQADASKSGRIKGFALKQNARIEQHSEVVRTTSPNVLGIIPGSDPALTGEYVLLMAHLDGLGVHDREGADDIHNGAMDNATGVATLLEVGRAIQESGNRPKRPILLAAVTAEEDGLLGAQYLARNPTVPAGGKVVGVVNLDMPVLLYDFQDVIAFGAEHSTMGPVVERAAAKIGITLTPDPLPQEGLFTRSDHYRFVQEGIPAVFLMTGFKNGGQEKFTGFLATDYHKPTDDLKLPFDWKAGAKFAQINYLIASEIANAPEAPRWYSDSFFGKTLAPNAQKAAR
jgi:Zn-dependent M28 family amino/carboxypeptidase